jgi:hypothetical protein
MLLQSGMTLVNQAFDVAMEPLAGFSPLISISLWAIFTALLVLLAYRFTSNQRAIHRVKELLQAHLLEVRLFQDLPRVVWRAYAKLLGATIAYLGWSLVPLAVVAIPVTLLIVELDLRYALRPILPGEAALVSVRVDDRTALDSISWDLPPGIAQTAPLVRIPSEKQCVARIVPSAAGRAEIVLHAAGQRFSKLVVTGDGLLPVSPARARGGWLEQILDPGEPPLPPGPVGVIEVSYPERAIAVGPWQMNWLWPFFVVTLIAGFALKGLVGAEF